MHDRFLRGALAATLLVSALACTEQVAGSLGCPELCSDQSAVLRDTVLTGAVVLDTAVFGFPQLGDTRDIALFTMGDTADVRLVARFDTVPNTYRLGAATVDSVIKRVDSAQLIFRIDTLVRPTVPVTIDAFDVDTTAADTLLRALLPLFRADRLLGTRTFQPAELKDTLRLVISDSAVLRKSASGGRLRIGLRLRSSQSARLQIIGTAFAPRVRFRVSTDSTVRPDTLLPLSRTPLLDPSIAAGFGVFRIVASGALGLPPAGRIVVGGLSGARSFLRFEIPPMVLDSVDIIRASLVLAQLPSRSPGNRADTLSLFAQAVVASPTITDVFTAAQFLGGGTAYITDTLRLAPRDSGTRLVELVNIVRLWRLVGTTNTSRAIVLRVTREGDLPGELNFASIEAAPALRPRLRLTYVPRRGFGLP
ncbi:MAG: hypothetical protein H0W68_02380 [Gemmatimonadaceae bacterium]|nr:hypothetical protein [Gemmatimonadaceae bacterium]